jgi:selenocysteine lyase/cysteine desulfurase
MPIKEIGELAKSQGIWYALDGAQAVAHLPVNLQGTGVDFYALSGHKWMLGPRRTGILYVRGKWLETLKPTIVGAYSNLDYDMEKRRLELHPTAQRYEYGTQNEALFYGLEAAVDFITAIGIDAIREHNKKLSEMFYYGLKKIAGVAILSPQEESYRSSIITFRIKDKDNRKICRLLEQKGLRVRSVTEANLDAVRASFHIYNNEAEKERLLSEIKKL